MQLSCEGRAPTELEKEKRRKTCRFANVKKYHLLRLFCYFKKIS